MKEKVCKESHDTPQQYHFSHSFTSKQDHFPCVFYPGRQRTDIKLPCKMVSHKLRNHLSINIFRNRTRSLYLKLSKSSLIARKINYVSVSEWQIHILNYLIVPQKKVWKEKEQTSLHRNGINRKNSI